VCVHHVAAGYPFPEHQKLRRPQLGVDLSTSGERLTGRVGGTKGPMCANVAIGDIGK
jgi:hypothetical protein